ncbi:MAG TPA: hypothetical protein VGD67_12605 [Pseudonocardiaceae bacterium]
MGRSEDDPPGWDEPIDGRDEAILAEVRQGWRDADPPPELLVDQVRYALGLTGCEELVLLAVAAPPVGVRGDDERTRRVTFSGSELTVMISIDAEQDGTVRVDGWLAPAGVFDVELRGADGIMGTRSDDGGRFALRHVPRGLATFLVRCAGGPLRNVVTPTVEL